MLGAQTTLVADSLRRVSGAVPPAPRSFSNKHNQYYVLIILVFSTYLSITIQGSICVGNGSLASRWAVLDAVEVSARRDLFVCFAGISLFCHKDKA